MAVLVHPPQISLPGYWDAKPRAKAPQRCREKSGSWSAKVSTWSEGGREPGLAGHAGKGHQFSSLHQSPHQKGALHSRGVGWTVSHSAWMFYNVSPSGVKFLNLPASLLLWMKDVVLWKTTWGWHGFTLFCRSRFVRLSGCTGLEVRGSGFGQDFPLGLSHSVNTGNYPDLYPSSADVPHLTLVSTSPLADAPQRLLLLFSFVSDSNLLIKLNETFILYISAVQKNISSCKCSPLGLQPATTTGRRKMFSVQLANS